MFPSCNFFSFLGGEDVFPFCFEFVLSSICFLEGLIQSFYPGLKGTTDINRESIYLA